MNQNPNNQNQGQQPNDAQLQLLMKKFRSKSDIYQYLDRVLQIYLPREKSCPLFFLHQILSNQKSHLMKNTVRTLKIPMWNELSIPNIWPQAIKLHNFQNYVPDEWQGKQSKVERTFFWAILTFLAEEYVDALIKDCRQQRTSAQLQRINQPQQMNIAANWIGPLLSEPFISNHGHQNILIQRAQPVQRRQAPQMRVIQPQVTMQDWLNHQAQQQQQNQQQQPAPQQPVNPPNIPQQQAQQNLEEDQQIEQIISSSVPKQQISASQALMDVADFMRDNFQDAQDVQQVDKNLQIIPEENDMNQQENSNATSQTHVVQQLFAPEPQVNNQLEMNSISEYNSVMGHSPIQGSMSNRTRRRKGADTKIKTKQPNFDE